MLHYLDIYSSSAYNYSILFMKIADINARLEQETWSFILYTYLIVLLLILETTDDSMNPLILFIAMNCVVIIIVPSIPAIYNYFKAARILAERVHVQCKRCVVDMYSVEV